MVDIHCHLLPGIDDGPKSWKATLEMCEKAVADGVTHLVATPHCNHRYTYDRPALQAMLDQLGEQFPTCTFSLGCELNVSQENLKNARDRSAWYTIGNTKYLLVEFNHFDLPTHMNNALSEFISLGLLPIIAHPERNMLLQRRIDLVEEWISFGCLTQITAGSLTGFWGPGPRKACETLLKKNLVHVIASDAHDSGRRSPELSSSRKAAAKIVGNKQATTLVSEFPAAIVRGELL
jgi:protein-tyrosine phosphatase